PLEARKGSKSRTVEPWFYPERTKMRPSKADRILHTVASADKVLAETIAGVALAFEALEALLVEKGILEKDAIMEKIKALIEAKQADSKAIPQADGDSRIIAP